MVLKSEVRCDYGAKKLHTARKASVWMKNVKMEDQVMNELEKASQIVLVSILETLDRCIITLEHNFLTWFNIPIQRYISFMLEQLVNEKPGQRAFSSLGVFAHARSFGLLRPGLFVPTKLQMLLRRCLLVS